MADASDCAKVGDQVRLLTRMLMTLEPDGQGTGCNPVEVGSMPTGVFGSQNNCGARYVPRIDASAPLVALEGKKIRIAVNYFGLLASTEYLKQRH